VPSTDPPRSWIDWNRRERAVGAVILLVEAALLLAVLTHGGRAWAPVVVIAGLGVLYVYDLTVQRRHRGTDG
jgi:hypothetical protein